MPFRLVFKNLFQHPVRTLLTMASLAVALFLLCLLRSLVVTLDAGVDAARADRIVVQSAASLFVDLPENYRSKIQQVEGVSDVCGWNWFGGYYQERKNFFAQFGVDHESLPKLYPEMEIVNGDLAALDANRRGCIVGHETAAKYQFDIGDRVPIISPIYSRHDGQPWEFDVVAIYRPTKPTMDGTTLYFRYDAIQKAREENAFLGPDGYSIFIVGVEEGHDPVGVMRRIDELFENGPQKVQATPEAEFQRQFVSMLGNVPFFVSAIGTGIFFAILMATLNTMLMAAREQTRDVGILKALGFTDGVVFRSLVTQSLLIALIGGASGIALAVVTSPFVQGMLGTSFPNYAVQPETVGVAVVATVLVGLVAGIVPAWRLASLRPVVALRQVN